MLVLCCSLKIGSTCIPQATAQLRYIGRAHDLYGSSNLEATMIDALMEGLSDLSSKVAPIIRMVGSPTQQDRKRRVYCYPPCSIVTVREKA